MENRISLWFGLVSKNKKTETFMPSMCTIKTACGSHAESSVRVVATFWDKAWREIFRVSSDLEGASRRGGPQKMQRPFEGQKRATKETTSV